MIHFDGVVVGASCFVSRGLGRFFWYSVYFGWFKCQLISMKVVSPFSCLLKLLHWREWRGGEGTKLRCFPKKVAIKLFFTFLTLEKCHQKGEYRYQAHALGQRWQKNMSKREGGKTIKGFSLCPRGRAGLLSIPLFKFASSTWENS